MARRSPVFGLGSLQLRKFRSWTPSASALMGKRVGGVGRWT